jgi:serine/threonine protein phosphatase 1
MPRRTIAVGDVHGCSRALAVLIDAIEPEPDDLIVTLGDYIDRGPDSRGVLDLLLSLGSRCQLVTLLGNHEQMLFDAKDPRPSHSGVSRYEVWLGYGGVATLESYGSNCGFEAIPARHLELLESCRYSFETETHLFTHASYFPSLPLEGQPASVLLWESLRDEFPGPHFSGKTAIVGHTSQKSGELLDLGYLKCIDTYCYGGGWLTALDVATGQLWQASENGELRRRES